MTLPFPLYGIVNVENEFLSNNLGMADMSVPGNNKSKTPDLSETSK